MNKRIIKRMVNWGGPVRAFIAMALMLPLLGVAPTVAPGTQDRAPQAQAMLLDMAAQRPDSKVSVIVQKLAKNNNVEAIVARLGGTVTKDLHIINAFAAEMPGKAVSELARAQGVRWVSLDAPVVKTCISPCISTSNLQSVYPNAVKAKNVWNAAPSYHQGQGIGVAVVDTGISPHPDLGARVVANVEFSSDSSTTLDMYGHGTHVAGIIGGDGTASLGRYIGMAPKVNLVNVKVSDDQGGASSSDVVAGMQWVLENKNTYNIRVVNLSFNSSIMQSYNVDPLAAASEVLWFNRIVVVVAAGNEGRNALYPPANDPFVITVGAVNDMGTTQTGDDDVATFSGAGITEVNTTKPEIVAPGVNLISLLSSPTAVVAVQHPNNLASGFLGSQFYFRMSGTSMSAPVVAGAVALLLQDEPNLNPDQVKYRLMAAARNLPGTRDGSGMLNAEGAVYGTTTQTANTGTPASQLLWTGSEPVRWESVNWSSVNWSSVNWSSVNWSSVNWSSVNWSSIYWEP